MIYYEFNSIVGLICNSLKDLCVWVDVNENLESVYWNIKINFEYFDGYFNLFIFLNRWLNRCCEEILGLEIKMFLIDLFKICIDRYNI